MNATGNQLPKITDFEKAIFLAQYAYENGFRGATFTDLYLWLKTKLDVLGLSNTAGLPEEFPQDGDTLSAADAGQWTILAPGTYHQPGYPSIEVAEGKVVFAQFDGTQFSIQREVEMPVSPADGEVAEGDTRAVSGGEVYSEFLKYSKSYQIINDINVDFNSTDLTITFRSNPLIYDIKSGHRVYLFPKNTVYPKVLNINSNKVLYVDEARFREISAAYFFSEEDIKEVDYGQNLHGKIPLLAHNAFLGFTFGLLKPFLVNNNITNELLQKIRKNLKIASGYTWEQGRINTSSGNLVNDTTRISTSFIECTNLERITVGDGFEASVAFYDSYKVFLYHTGIFRRDFDYPIVDGTSYIRVVVRKINNADILPTEDVSEKIYISDLVSKKYTKDLLYEEVVDFDMISGTIDQSHGNDLSNTKRIKTDFIPTKGIKKITVGSDYRFLTYYYNENKDFIGSSAVGVWLTKLEDVNIDGYVRIVVRANPERNIDINEDTGLTLVHKPKYQAYGNSGVPEGGSEGDVLTPNGWNGDYVKNDQLENYVQNDQLAAHLSGLVSQSNLAQQLENYIQKTEQVEFLKDEIVTPSKLSQSTMDLINASGGGTITNLADDEDIESVGGFLRLKDTDVARFRVKSTPQANFDELTRCIATGLPILIKDSVDLANTDGSIRTINLVNNTLIFEGNGEIKNCLIQGSFYVRAGRKKIFDNVYFHRFRVNNVNQINKDSVFNVYPANTDYDIFNLYSKELTASDLNTPYDPFKCSLTVFKIGNFQTPILEGEDYVYKEGASTLLTFVKVGDKIRVPIRKDYVFTDQNGNVLTSSLNLRTFEKTYVDIEPENLRVSRLLPPVLTKIGRINNEIYPEWFGAVPNNNTFDNKQAFQLMHLIDGTYSLSSGATYWLSGGVLMYSSIIIQGNRATLKMLPTSVEKCMYEIETRYRQNGITIYDLNLSGHKTNGVIQDGIFADPYRGIVDGIDGYSFDNTYWYNMKISDFSGSGIMCGVPGTSHIYSSYISYNAMDGVAWWMEHFTLNNCTSWGNGRHGVFTGGNHWRIIGGAYAHNGAGSNIHCVGAAVSQIIGCSVIHSGVFLPKTGGGYAASSLNVYGYIWVGEGMGTHEMIGGDGIYLENCNNMVFVGVRVSGANANSFNLTGNTRKINITSCIFEGVNLVRKDFKNIGGSAANHARISNSEVDGQMISSNKGDLLMFGTYTETADWNDLKGTLKYFGQGVFNIRDSYNAKNRPVGVTGQLVGTIRIATTFDNSIGRVFIELLDQSGNIYTRFFNITMSTGVYDSDTGWKKFIPN